MINSTSPTPTTTPLTPPGFHSGFACLVGRPNVGKSTLINALVGQKVAITSDKPQTTRNTIRGIITRPDAQLVVVDTPGVHRPRTLLGEWLTDMVRTTLTEVDVIGMCLPATEPIGPGDRYLMRELAGLREPTVVGIVTKTDLATSDQVAGQLLSLQQVSEEENLTVADFIPVSATAGHQVGELTEVLISHLPPGPAYYPSGELTDEPEQHMVAELVREAALTGVREELPHSLAVLVEEMIPRENRPKNKPLTDVYVTIYVERPSQRAIVIGSGGSRLREIGSQARQSIEALLGTPIYLDLRVKVAKDWQRDPKQMRKLGFDR